MIFDEFPCETAEGVTLAHTLKLGGRTLKKGRVLSSDDLAALSDDGIETVLGARLAPDDMAENPAASAIAERLVGPGANAATRAPYNGRCNLHASVRGIVEVDAERIDRLNLLGESVAIGTLPQHAVARAGQVIATIKIVPFAVPRHVVEACREIASGGPLVRVAELKPHRVALIMSELPGMKESIFTGTVAATRHRVEGLGSRLALVLRCAHERAAIEARVRQALAAGCNLVLVCGATVAKDRRDIAPAAVTAAGGEIVHFGMPTEPGNMLVLGRVGAVPVVILPGCGRSRRMNGLDWILQRLLAGLAPSAQDIMRMGVGGLIRTTLEAEDDEDEDENAVAETAPEGPRIAALVLAAGRSSRMGADNKLLAEVGGVPMVLRAVNSARASLAASVTVVVGHEGDAVANAVGDTGATVVRNPDFAQGMSASLRHGIAALPDDADAVLVLLGDMPRISAEHLDRIIAAFDPAQPSIVVPEKDGRRGNPILWPREFFAAMTELSGDQGARGLIAAHADRVKRVAVDDDAIFVDVDRPCDLAAVRTSARPEAAVRCAEACAT
ncbi:MAG: molybdopterin-binding/glycosyltransferase family 2 protein [Aromatoleum sp.]|jgi:molybdenum cofactor cytidylyltransferase|uniref:molybdopterin-binding/glycosyltransferase family 2 protein n=1 Tax=Aromatoleum sp. TaxID=2307007 RepID=UPI00289484CF|nr:molybdopterin-binding/glycosyltransferase family 2 protein [Aromatoleum sp.]MDT3669414.1 molybdopterin-binding/glycosyltransferase family 2 protein [Aromatoleum sp.]